MSPVGKCHNKCVWCETLFKRLETALVGSGAGQFSDQSETAGSVQDAVRALGVQWRLSVHGELAREGEGDFLQERER